MKQRTTRTDVANRAGVSKTTVTFALSDRYDIAIPEPTRQRVKNAARELGYRPSAIARALVAGKTYSMTVAFPNLIVAHYARVLQTLERQLNSSGYHMIASTIGHIEFKNVMPDLLSIFTNASDGLILVDMPPAFKLSMDEMQPFTKPIVTMGICDFQNMDCVRVNMLDAAVAAMDHLMASSPKRIAFFCSVRVGDDPAMLERWLVESREARTTAYFDAMRARRRRTEVIVGVPTDRRGNIAIVERYVQSHGCPDAIFCYDDELALSAHFALRRLGYRLGKDVLLVGCDGNDECEYTDPPLTTIAQPVEAMCGAAWEFMQNRLREPSAPPQHAELNCKLIIRESSQS